MADTDVRERYGPGDPNEALIENTARPALAVADPAPLGLAAFALTTFMLSGHIAGFIPDIAWVGLALFYGGMIQLLAGMWEFRNKNVFGATAFSTYGGFWLGLGCFVILIELTKLGKAVSNVDDALAWFLVAFAISGRGGGALYISHYLQPRSMTGMDFSQEAVDLCNRHRHAPGLCFVCGDAQSMPFPASSFDAVVNIESSHCYESMDTFLSEVCRVLRPGGRFFFADLRSVDSVTTLREQFGACGLTVEKETDITANVLAALRLDNARKLELIDAWIPRVFHRPFGVFAGIAGTRNYAGLESGKLRYLSAQLAKSTPAQA
jgi:SAM-dependent methyltransferase